MKKAFATVFALLTLLGCAQSPTREGGAGYAVDAAWPKPLPNNWILGQVAGIAVDARDHVWLIHRPKTLIDEEKGAALSPPRAKCCVAAPPVIEFDGEGNLLRAWGGPGQGYDWFENEHGITVDTQGNVWVGGNDPKDHQLIKFTPDGKFLMQVGRAGQTGGSNSPTLLGRPAHMEIDPQANELYIADGYGNKRVIVLDAASGVYKRHWAPTARRRATRSSPYTTRSRRSSRTRCTACAFRTTVWSTSATAPTTACRCSRRTEPSSSSSCSRRSRSARARPSTWCSRTTRSRNISTSPTAPTTRCSPSSASRAECSPRSAGPAATPGSSWCCTTSASTRRAISTRPRSAAASARRNSGLRIDRRQRPFHFENTKDSTAQITASQNALCSM